MMRVYDDTHDGGYDGYDGNKEDQDSVPSSSNDEDGGSEGDSEDEDVITFSNTSSSSMLPAALATVRVETTVGKEVIRGLGKRKSCSLYGTSC